MGAVRILLLFAAANTLQASLHAQTATPLSGPSLALVSERLDPCNPTALFCDSRMASRSTGLNLSLVGRARVTQGIAVYGKLGTAQGRVDANLLGAGETGFGFAVGGGVSYDITPQLSATLEWDARDLRFQGLREPVRSTSLGLQLRY